MKQSNYQDLDFLKEFKSFITPIKRGKRLKKDGSKLKKITIRKLETRYVLLQNFSKEKDFQLRIKILRKDKRQFNAEKIYWQRFYLKFTDYLYYEMNCYDNYVGSIIKDIRTFFNYLIKEKNLSIGNFHQHFYVYKEDIQILTLLPDQFQQLICNQQSKEQKLTLSLLRAQDIFLAGCTVALRYSDLMNLTKNNLQIFDNQYYLKVQSQKTKTYTNIKLPVYAVEIFKKYSAKGNRLLPNMNLMQLNTCLKKLCASYGWTSEFVKTRQKRGEAIGIYKNAKQKTNFRFCDLVSSHIMRRTAITTMLRLGMAESLVRKISGHAPNSLEFHKYVAIAQDYLDTETDKVFAKLIKK